MKRRFPIFLFPAGNLGLRGCRVLWILMALAGVNRALAREQTDMRMWQDRYNQAVEHAEAGRTEEASALFEQVVKSLTPPASALEAALASSAANNQGNIELGEGDGGEAMIWYEKALELNPLNADARNNQGVVHLRRGDVENAQAAFEEAVKLNPGNVRPLNNLARLALEAGQWRLAANLLMKALELGNAPHQETLYLLADLYARTDMPERLEAVWKQMKPDTSGEQEAMVREMLDRDLPSLALAALADITGGQAAEEPWAALEAVALARLGRLDEAAERLGRLAADPESPFGWYCRISVRLSRDRVEEAVELAATAVERFPDDALLWFAYGDGLQRQGKLDEAAYAYEKSLQGNDPPVESWNNLGVLYARKGREARAIRSFEGALRRRPLYGDARYNLARTLIVTQRDYERGIRMMVPLARSPGEAGEKARAFLNDIETIQQGGDPGWGAAGGDE